MTGAVSHSQPAVSEFTWQDLSDASAEEGPDGFVFYNENDKGLDASGDPREATIQPEVGEAAVGAAVVGEAVVGEAAVGAVAVGAAVVGAVVKEITTMPMHQCCTRITTSTQLALYLRSSLVTPLWQALSTRVRRLPHNTILLCKSRALNISQRMPPTPPPLLLMMMETLRVVKQLTWVASNSAKSNVIISARSARRKLRRSTRHANETSPARSWVVAGISTSGSTNLVAARRSAT